VLSIATGYLHDRVNKAHNAYADSEEENDPTYDLDDTPRITSILIRITINTPLLTLIGSLSRPVNLQLSIPIREVVSPIVKENR